MIDCGIDESQPVRKDVIFVSAIIGQTPKMAKLTRAWQKELDDNNVDYFHAKEHWNKRAKPYHNLSMRKRKKLLDRLAKLTRRHVHLGISVRIDIAEYMRVTSQRFRNNWGAPYSFAIQMLILGIHRDLLHRKQLHETVNVLIEDGHKNLDQILEMLSKSIGKSDALIKIGNYGKGPKLGNPILQAADMLAYGSCQQFSSGKNVTIRKSEMFAKLASKDPSRFPTVFCNEALIASIKEGIDGSFARRRELRLKSMTPTNLDADEEDTSQADPKLD